MSVHLVFIKNSQNYSDEEIKSNLVLNIINRIEEQNPIVAIKNLTITFNIDDLNQFTIEGEGKKEYEKVFKQLLERRFS